MSDFPENSGNQWDSGPDGEHLSREAVRNGALQNLFLYGTAG